MIGWGDSGCPYRRAAFECVHGWAEEVAVQLRGTVVTAGSSPFVKAVALNRAIKRSSADVIVQMDADALGDCELVADAVADALTAPGCVFPHDVYVFLTRAATAALIDGGEILPADIRQTKTEGWGYNTVGLCAVYTKETWRLAQGYDERFVRWGGDDAAFALAAGALAGQHRRYRGDVIHLWHPRAPGSLPGNRNYKSSSAILSEYVEAAEIGPDAMRALIAAR